MIDCSRIVPVLSLEQSQKNIMNQEQEKNLLC